MIHKITKSDFKSPCGGFRGLFAALAFCGLSMGAVNAQTWNIGTPTATDVKATLDTNGTLTISGTGTGKMQDFANYNSAPWYSVNNTITALVIQSGVTSIGNYAFYTCNNITGTLTIPGSVVSIGKEAFEFCYGLVSVTIPNSVASIGSGAFYGCRGLTAINVDASNSNYSSDNGVLYNKNKTTLIQCPGGKSGTYIIANTVTSIASSSFTYCSLLTSITIPDSVISIGSSVFEGCIGLTSISIGNSVTSFGSYAFRNCIGITSITIPNSVSSIGGVAFQGCTGLTSVTCLNPNPATITLGNTVFDGVPTTTCILKVPCGSVGAYQMAAQWSAFKNIENIPMYSELNDTICYGKIYAENGFNESATGTYYLTEQNTSGCDSIVTLNLFVFDEVPETIINATIGQGKTYTENGFNESASGTYHRTEQNINGCDSVITLILNVTTTGISTITNDKLGMRVYPNPTSGQLRVSGDILDGKDREIRIFNVVGQVVFTSQLSKLSPETTIDISHLANGLYFLKVDGKMVKIVKE